MPSSPSKSLAPPRGASVDIGIDATTPPTPIRKAREERLRNAVKEESPFDERPLTKHSHSEELIDEEETLIDSKMPKDMDSSDKESEVLANSSKRCSAR